LIPAIAAGAKTLTDILPNFVTVKKHMTLASMMLCVWVFKLPMAS